PGQKKQVFYKPQTTALTAADPTDPTTWGTWAEALEAKTYWEADGISSVTGAINKQRILERHLASRLAQMHALLNELTSSPYSHDMLEITLAIATSVAISNLDVSELVWLFLVAPPGYDKTTTVMVLKGSPQVFVLDTLTENAFISGFVDPRSEEKK